MLLRNPIIVFFFLASIVSMVISCRKKNADPSPIVDFGPPPCLNVLDSVRKITINQNKQSGPNIYRHKIIEYTFDSCNYLTYIYDITSDPPNHYLTEYISSSLIYNSNGFLVQINYNDRVSISHGGSNINSKKTYEYNNQKISKINTYETTNSGILFYNTISQNENEIKIECFSRDNKITSSCSYTLVGSNFVSSYCKYFDSQETLSKSTISNYTFDGFLSPNYYIFGRIPNYAESNGISKNNVLNETTFITNYSNNLATSTSTTIVNHNYVYDKGRVIYDSTSTCNPCPIKYNYTFK